MSEGGGRTTGKALAIAALGIVVALALLGYAYLRGELTCAFDTSYCATTAEKNGIYRGTLLDENGDPYENSPFAVAFESREGKSDVQFTTGSGGSFCVQWAGESIVPHVNSPGLQVAPAGSTPNGLTNWKSVGTDRQIPGCQKGNAAIPWDRAKDASSSWQFRLLLAVPAIAMIALILSLTAVRMRLPRLREFGWAAIGAALALQLLL